MRPQVGLGRKEEAQIQWFMGDSPLWGLGDTACPARFQVGIATSSGPGQAGRPQTRSTEETEAGFAPSVSTPHAHADLRGSGECHFGLRGPAGVGGT